MLLFHFVSLSFDVPALAGSVYGNISWIAPTVTSSVPLESVTSNLSAFYPFLTIFF